MDACLKRVDKILVVCYKSPRHSNSADVRSMEHSMRHRLNHSSGSGQQSVVVMTAGAAWHDDGSGAYFSKLEIGLLHSITGSAYRIG